MSFIGYHNSGLLCTVVKFQLTHYNSQRNESWLLVFMFTYISHGRYLIINGLKTFVNCRFRLKPNCSLCAYRILLWKFSKTLYCIYKNRTNWFMHIFTEKKILHIKREEILNISIKCNNADRFRFLQSWWFLISRKIRVGIKSF